MVIFFDLAIQIFKDIHTEILSLSVKNLTTTAMTKCGSMAEEITAM